MKVLCYGVFVKFLTLCGAANVTQKAINGTLLLSIDSRYDIRDDDHTASLLTNCKTGVPNNISDPKVWRKVTTEHLVNYFTENILPLINPEKENLLVKALSDIISDKNFRVKRVGRLGRQQILKEKDTATFLVNVFLYTLALPNRNPVAEAFVATLNDAYLEQFATSAHDDDNEDEAIIAPQQLLLFVQTEGRCLSCGEPMFHENDVGECYMDPQTVEYTDTNSNEKTDFFLCPRCAAKFPHLSDGKKCELVAQFKRQKLSAELPTHLSFNEKSNEQIALIIKELHDKGALSQSPQKFEIHVVEDKVKNIIIKSKIIENVTYRYYDVNEALNNLATANRLNTNRISKVMGRLYEDVATTLGYDRFSASSSNIALQERVYDDIVNEVNSRSHHESRTVCEWLVAYFVQMCVIFDAISK